MKAGAVGVSGEGVYERILGYSRDGWAAVEAHGLVVSRGRGLKSGGRIG